MFKHAIFIFAACALTIAKPQHVVAPAVVTAQSSQYFARNYNALAAPLLAAAPVLATPPVAATAPFVPAVEAVRTAPIPVPVPAKIRSDVKETEVEDLQRQTGPARVQSPALQTKLSPVEVIPAKVTEFARTVNPAVAPIAVANQAAIPVAYRSAAVVSPYVLAPVSSAYSTSNYLRFAVI